MPIHLAKPDAKSKCRSKLRPSTKIHHNPLSATARAIRIPPTSSPNRNALIYRLTISCLPPSESKGRKSFIFPFRGILSQSIASPPRSQDSEFENTKGYYW